MKRALFLLALVVARGETPFAGVTYEHHANVPPRNADVHVVTIDLTQPGLRFRVTPQGGARETVRQTTLDFLREQHAQIAINAHFFEPFPSEEREAFLIGPAASDGNAYSDFEMPRQSYAILDNAPALNIDAANHAAIVRKGTGGALYNAIAGSAQVVTQGVMTIPHYVPGELTPGNGSSSENPWYDRPVPRTLIALDRDARKLVLMVTSRSTVGEAAEFLIRNYMAWDALNLDGGGSTSLAMEDPVTHEPRLLNSPSDSPQGRAVGSSLAVFVPSLVN